MAELLAPSAIETLRAFHTPDELRAYLRIGFPRAELDHVGFEQVSLAECIDRVVAASFAQRARPDAADTNHALVDALDVHRAVVHDVHVRRRAGAASCLPGR